MVKEVKIQNLKIKYDVDYRNIRYPRLEFRTGNLMLIMPENYGKEKKLLEKHKKWVYNKQLEIINSLKESKKKKLNLSRESDEFKDLVKQTIRNYTKRTKLGIGGVYFRRMKSKWASCSSNKNLTINVLLKHLPNELIEYVLYHELMHLRERKHTDSFWRSVKKKFPNYPSMEKDLFVYWFLIQKKMRTKN